MGDIRIGSEKVQSGTPLESLLERLKKTRTYNNGDNTFTEQELKEVLSNKVDASIMSVGDRNILEGEFHRRFQKTSQTSSLWMPRTLAETKKSAQAVMPGAAPRVFDPAAAPNTRAFKIHLEENFAIVVRDPESGRIFIANLKAGATKADAAVQCRNAMIGLGRKAEQLEVFVFGTVGDSSERKPSEEVMKAVRNAFPGRKVEPSLMAPTAKSGDVYINAKSGLISFDDFSIYDASTFPRPPLSQPPPSGNRFD